jgi:hypothetical protein
MIKIKLPYRVTSYVLTLSFSRYRFVRWVSKVITPFLKIEIPCVRLGKPNTIAHLIKDVYPLKSIQPCGCSSEGNPIKWNEFNKVVQCHKCGSQYKLVNKKRDQNETKI